MTNEQDGAAQVARLNTLLAEIAERLVSQDTRIRALEKGAMLMKSIILDQQQLFALAKAALTGHQQSIEALAQHAGLATDPAPLPRRLMN